MPPHPTSWRSILTLLFHLRLGLPSGLFSSGFPTKTLYTPLLLPIRATCSAHHLLFDMIIGTTVGEEYKSLSSSLCSFLHSPLTSSLLGPNIPLNTLFSNTLSLRSSLSVNDQISHPYKTTCISVCVCIYMKLYIWWVVGLFPTYVKALLFKCLQDATLMLANVCSCWCSQITRILCMLFNTDWHSVAVTHILQIAVRPCSISQVTCMLSTSSASVSLRYSLLLSSHRLLGHLSYLFQVLIPTYVTLNTNLLRAALYLLIIAATYYGTECWPSSGSQSVSLARATDTSTWYTVGILRMIRIVVMEIKCCFS